MKKMNVYERVRLYLFTWLNDTYTHTHTYKFIYIYLTYAFGFVERLAIHHTVLNVLSWGRRKSKRRDGRRKFVVCLTWNDPKRNGTRLRKNAIHNCGMIKTTCQSNTVLSRYPKEGPAFKINHYGMFFISNSFWKHFLLVAQPACLST